MIEYLELPGNLLEAALLVGVHDLGGGVSEPIVDIIFCLLKQSLLFIQSTHGIQSWETLHKVVLSTIHYHLTRTLRGLGLSIL